MRVKITYLIVFIHVAIVLSGLSISLYGQTCSCAGTTSFNPFEYTDSDKSQRWHFRLSYKYHAINDLVEGSKKVVDATDRSRIAQSVFFSLGFDFDKRISLIALLHYSDQSRDVGISNSGAVSTGSIGDSMLAIQYSPLIHEDKKGLEITIGSGIKAPTGASNVKLVGIASEDMQPGTGSWDIVLWTFAATRLYFISGLELFTGVSFRFNGGNDRDYKFGNELISSLGLNLANNSVMDFALFARYRHTSGDRRFNALVPNTGGDWIYIVPSIKFKWKKFEFKTEVELPVYRKLNGFRQFTSTFLVSMSVSFKI